MYCAAIWYECLAQHNLLVLNLSVTLSTYGLACRLPYKPTFFAGQAVLLRNILRTNWERGGWARHGGTVTGSERSMPCSVGLPEIRAQRTAKTRCLAQLAVVVPRHIIHSWAGLKLLPASLRQPNRYLLSKWYHRLDNDAMHMKRACAFASHFTWARVFLGQQVQEGIVHVVCTMYMYCLWRQSPSPMHSHCSVTLHAT